MARGAHGEETPQGAKQGRWKHCEDEVWGCLLSSRWSFGQEIKFSRCVRDSD